MIYYPNCETVQQAIAADSPLLVLVAYDESRIIISNIDDCGEHIILLRLVGFSDNDLDKYYRIVLNRDGADWTFVCPNDYKGIEDKARRIQQFYKDGFAIIPQALNALGYMCGIDIPKRYRRHIDMM